MSVYGNMMLENNKSIIDISNEMTEICAEFTGYNNFFNEFIIESNIQITNEGVGETIKTVFTKIKDFIKSIIDKIREFISSLFNSNKKNKTKEKDQKAKEAIKQLDKYELIPLGNSSVSTDAKTIKNVKIGSVKRFAPLFKEIFKASEIAVKECKNNTSLAKSVLSSMPNMVHQIDDPILSDKKDALNQVYDELSGNIVQMAEQLTRLRYNPKDIEIIGENGTLADFKKLPSNIKQELLTGISYYKETSKKYSNEIQKQMEELYNFITEMEKKSKSLVSNIDSSNASSVALQPYVKIPNMIGKEVTNVNKLLPIYSTIITQFENQRDRILNAIKISKLSFRN